MCVFTLCVCVCVCASHPVSGGQSRVTHGGREHAHQQVLDPGGGGAHVEQPLLEHAQRGHLGAHVQAQHLAEASQELDHHEAV